MANCPMCGTQLRLTDWKQNCPKCGGNILAYGFQEKLMQDADKAEVEHYHFQKRLDRVKGSFAASKLSIIRIFTCILPLGPLFLPLAKLKITAGLEPFDGKFSFVTLIKKYESLADFDALGEFLKGGAASYCCVAAFGLLVLSLLVTVTHLALLALSCSKKGKVRNYTQDILIIVFTLASIIVTAFAVKGEYVTASVSFGAFIYLLLQIVNFAVDIAVFKENIEITHKQCYVGGIPIEEYFEMQEMGWTTEQIRAEQYKRLQIRHDQKVKENQEALAKAQAEKEAEIAKAKERLEEDDNG